MLPKEIDKKNVDKVIFMANGVSGIMKEHKIIGPFSNKC